MKIINRMILLMVLLVIALVIVLGHFVGKMNDYENSYKTMVGVEVVYKQDTLMIVDYSLLNETVKLDNNLEISFELVKKLPQIKIEE